MTFGRIAFLAVLVLLVYWAPQWMPDATQEPAPPPNPVLDSLRKLQAHSGAPAARKEAALEQVLKNADAHGDTLSAHHRAMLEELRSARGETSRRKIAIRLITELEAQSGVRTLTFGEWLADVWTWMRESYLLIQPQARSSLWLIAFMLVVLGFAGTFLSLPHVARRAALLGLRLARSWLVVLSFLAVTLALVTRTNPWPAVPRELLFPPIVALIGCAFALRFVDFNYPVWNSVVRGCGAPLIAMAFISVYLMLA